MVLSALVTFSYNNPDIDLGTVRSYLGTIIPDCIAIPLSSQYQNLFVNSRRNGTGIDVSQHELADGSSNNNRNNASDNDDGDESSNSSSSSKNVNKSSNNKQCNKSIELIISNNKYSTGKKKHTDVDDIEEITL